MLGFPVGGHIYVIHASYTTRSDVANLTRKVMLTQVRQGSGHL